MGVHKAPAKEAPFKTISIDGIVITVGAQAATVINVGIQLKNGGNLEERGHVDAYLSDDEYGNSIVASAPDGGWAIGTDGLLIPLVANKAAKLVSESDGDIDIDITESETDTFYLAVCMPDGSLEMSDAIAFTTSTTTTTTTTT